jgi:hypothetical protein
MPGWAIASTASVTRFALSGSGSLIMSMSTLGMTCHDKPYLSVASHRQLPGRHRKAWPGSNPPRPGPRAGSGTRWPHGT